MGLGLGLGLGLAGDVAARARLPQVRCSTACFCGRPDLGAMLLWVSTASWWAEAERRPAHPRGDALVGLDRELVG